MNHPGASPGAGNAAWLSLVADQEVTPPELLTVEEVVAFRSDPSRDLRRHNVDLPENVEIRHTVLGEVEGLQTAAEIYVPDGPGPFPMMLYMHGGGWCLGKAEYVRKLGMSISARGHVVVNLDYALAPEHPFPAALRQAIFATRWMVRNASEVKGDGGPVAIGGASAGANLAAASIVALAAEDDAEVRFSAALLLYGVFNFPLVMEKPGTYAGGFAETVFNLAYLGPHWLTKHRDPLVSPALAPNLDRFPPSYLVIGDQDSLLPQSLDMAERLIGHGVPTTLSVPAGLNHSFAYIPHKLPDAAAELERMFDWLSARTGAALRQEVPR
ncbi:MAG: acetyl esterase [Thermoleophilaceae bacterium]|jgi:acetyl esterase|nr:acetyl esterase [Thermoleophilaceae bacterium]